MSAATILVVDDDPAVLGVTKVVLAQHGYHVLGASGGHAALRIVEQTRIDLVLSDVAMPGIAGPQLLERVRRLSPSTATALMSGFSGTEELDPAVAFIPKPFSAAGLVAKVQELLARSEQLGAQLDDLCAKATELIEESRRLGGELVATRSEVQETVGRSRKQRSGLPQPGKA